MPARAAVHAGSVAASVLPSAGVHFGEHAVQHDPTALELHVIMAQAQQLIRRLAHQRKAARHQFVAQTLAPKPQSQLAGMLAQRLPARARNSASIPSTSPTIASMRDRLPRSFRRSLPVRRHHAIEPLFPAEFVPLG